MKTTKIVILAVVALLLVYDIFIMETDPAGMNASLSWVVWTLSHRFPIIPFVSGLLCGHLFWTQTSSVRKLSDENWDDHSQFNVRFGTKEDFKK